MGSNLPEDVWVVGISTIHVYDFREVLSPPMRKAVPKFNQIVAELLNTKHHNSLKKKVICTGDFLHLGCNLLRDYSKDNH